jgi:homoserine O-acetyltransferase
MSKESKRPDYVSGVGQVGIVEELTYMHKDRFEMENGWLEGFELRYETYGELNEEGTNAILICHALTGDHHVAGVYEKEDQRPGWWNHVVGPGKAIDTEEFFVVCSNCLGACKGSTGPASENPATPGKPYGMLFPDLTIKDMVAAQKQLLDFLGVNSLHAVVGGSMGGMQTLQWVVAFPDFVKRALIIAATARHNAQTIAFNEVGRRSICGDPQWKDGRYLEGEGPKEGLAVARMMAHITYLSDEGMEERFGREIGATKDKNFEFSVESYLDYQGSKFVDRFDANTYLKLTRALDRFDLVGEKGLEESLQVVSAKVLVVAFTSDWLYTPAQNKLIVEALHRSGKEASYLELDHKHGHDSFLINSKAFLRSVRVFLNGMDESEKGEQNIDRFRKVESRYEVKKEADFKVIDHWVQPGESVLDLGCGRGILLEYLRDSKQVRGLGVDYDTGKATSSVARGVAVYQEDIGRALQNLGEHSFDWVIFSRMVEELPSPGTVILDALRVGKRVALSFVNHGYWRNRMHFLRKGMRIRNDVYPDDWEKSGLKNHFSISEFERFCKANQSGPTAFAVGRKVYHQGDWVKTCNTLPNLRAGLAIYELTRK